MVLIELWIHPLPRYLLVAQADLVAQVLLQLDASHVLNKERAPRYRDVLVEKRVDRIPVWVTGRARGRATMPRGRDSRTSSGCAAAGRNESSVASIANRLFVERVCVSKATCLESPPRVVHPPSFATPWPSVFLKC